MAGAAGVMIASPYRYAIMRELRGEGEPSLQEQLGRLTPADLTLVEGYKWEALPKLEVFRPGFGRPPLYPDDPLVVAVSSDVPAPGNLALGPAWLDLNARDSVLAWLSNWIMTKPKVSQG